MHAETRNDIGDRHWLAVYPADIPAEISMPANETLASIWNDSVAKYADMPAFSALGCTLTYAELDRRVERFAAYVNGELGLAPGDRLAIMLPNVLQYPVAMFGALRAGLTVVNVNPLYTPRELKHQLSDSGARAIVVLSNFAATVAAVLDDVPLEHVIVSDIGDMLPAPRRWLVNTVVKRVKKAVPPYAIPAARKLRECLATGGRHTLPAIAASPDDLAFLQYTGGTTGLSKGAMLTHANVCANLHQLLTFSGPLVRPGKEISVTALPLYHIFALVVNCFAMVKAGGMNLLIANPREPAGMVAEMSKWPFTMITGVNTLFNALLHTPGFEQLDFSTLRCSLGGGSAIQKVVAERWREVTGSVILQGYGLTEASPVVTGTPYNADYAYSGSIGVPYPSTEVVIVGDDGEPVPAGEPGELWVRGPQVMKGYWQRPEATAETITADGFLCTGDVATMDEKGYLRIVDRKKDMILVSAFNVYPNEIEQIAMEFNGVLEAACIGVPDEKTGEAVKLFVAPKPGATIDPDALRKHCRDNMTGYKVPKYIEIRAELPKTNVGKILRRALRETSA